MTDLAPQRPSAPPPRKTLVAVGVLGMLGLLVFAAAAIFASPAVLDRARPGTAAPAAGGVQELTVEVANGVYAPNVIRAKAGVPLRLHVVVRERHSCATKLLVPDLGLAFDLPGGGAADLDVPATAAGAHIFTCGQKMVKGSLVFE